MLLKMRLIQWLKKMKLRSKTMNAGIEYVAAEKADSVVADRNETMKTDV